MSYAQVSVAQVSYAQVSVVQVSMAQMSVAQVSVAQVSCSPNVQHSPAYVLPSAYEMGMLMSKILKEMSVAFNEMCHYR